MNLKAMITQNPVASFIVLTLGLSVASLFLPVEGEMAFAIIALILVMFPTIVAIGLEAIMGGRRGVMAFVRECFRWRGTLKWAIIAIGIGFLMNFGVSVLAVLLGKITVITISAPVVFRLLVVPHAALLEEIGWRGFALRRLLDRHSPLAASLIIGVPWGVIHLLLVFLYVPGRTGIWDGLAILPITFALTWIFIKSKHKVVVSTVLHISLNSFTFVAPLIPEGEWLAVISYSLITAVLVLVGWHMWLSQPLDQKVSEPVPSTV
ncbi:MAG: CPBP family intramembrane metalloprotease [Anaerolineaceae bacterium]|nr:CPBP family intramembrane metalloprotease [Anaerolineaceae bacterium]